MDIGSTIGLLVGLSGIVAGYLLEEGILSKLYQLSALCIVFGGTLGATIVSFPFSEIKKLGQAFKIIFSKDKNDEIAIINELASLSDKARRDGLLALEEDAENSSDPFIKKGLSLVVDGLEAELIRDILDREVSLHESIYESSAKIFEAMGGFAPTMGVLGTVMGMVSILANMEDPATLGPKISAAFIATMYGVGSANLLFLPLAGRIKAKVEKQKAINEIIIEGLLSIQAGENPKVIREKLNLSLWEKMKGKSSSMDTAGKGLEG